MSPFFLILDYYFFFKILGIKILGVLGFLNATEAQFKNWF